MEVYSRMIYFIFATSKKGIQHACGIALTFFSNLSMFGDSLNRISYEYQKFFNERNEFVNHDFAIGRYTSSSELEIWWPNTLTAEKEEKRLLEFVAKKNYSGSETRKNGNKITTKIWKFIPGERHLFAGVTQAKPDLWILFMFQLLPYIGGVFSFLSLFLLADFLWELFARPVKSFTPALIKISEGEYQTRIVIEKTDELGILADSFNAMAEGLQQREKMRRFVSEKLLENVEQDNTLQKSRSQEMELSVLMSDIRGFTSLSEKYSPEEIVNLLNDYFTEMEEAIIENGGTVERFIGDAIVAAFYPKTGEDNQSQRSVNAAFAMRERLRKLNENRALEGKFLVENGIGIVTDVAISGVTGAKSGRQVFMIVGSIVPRAAELEAITASLKGNRIAVCPRTAALATKTRFEQVDSVANTLIPVENDA